MLRVAIGYGFRRARLRYGYSLLRGKDLETGQYSRERREAQFAGLRKAQADVLNLENWHGFLRSLQVAGYRSSRMISSDLAVIYSYVFYLIGLKALGADRFELSGLIARWFFMTAVTGRYTGSSESQMEQDLAAIREFSNAALFHQWIEKTIDSQFTDDFWEITLPNQMETSSATSPFLFAYHAALNILDAKALFSNKKIVDLLDPTHVAKKSAVERHHLFPKDHLKSIGITGVRETNQLANYALVEWSDNISISGDAPFKYFPVYAERAGDLELSRMAHWHALPVDWHRMEYREFLEARRKLMAKVIREGFQYLTRGENQYAQAEDVVTADQLIKGGETSRVEFKSTLRMNLHTGDRDKRMEHSCLKTIAAFLNSHGGHLVVGVNDNGEPLGLGNDQFPNEDKMQLHLINLLKEQLGAQHLIHVEPRFESVDGGRVLVVNCRRSSLPVYLRDGNGEHFYVRTGGATNELTPSQIQGYVRQRF